MEESGASGFVQEMPEEFREMPEDGLFYWLAWQELRSDRHIGAMGGIGPIFYVAKSRYANDHSIRGSEFEAFMKIVSQIDAVYVEVSNKAAEEARKKPPEPDSE